MRVLQTVSRPNAATTSWPDETQTVPVNIPDSSANETQPRLDGAECRRRLLHMFPGLFPFLLWVIPHTDPWGPILVSVLWILTILIGSSALLRFRAFARESEDNGRDSVIGYALPVLGTLCLCRGCEEVGVMTLAVLAFGDGSATLGGLLIGGSRLPWNMRKTWAGLISFWIVGGVFATVMYWGEARPVVSWTTALVIAGPTVLLAGAAETLPVRINDNWRVGVLTAVMGMALHRWIVG